MIVTKLLVSVGLVALFVMPLVASASYRAVLRWAGIWGVGFGLWIVAPAVFHAHHLSLSELTQWIWFLGLIASIVGIVGAVATGALLFPVGLYWIQRPPRGRLVPPLFAFASVPVSYCALSAAIERVRFGRLISVDLSDGGVRTLIALWFLVICLVIVGYKRVRDSQGGQRLRWLRIVAAGVICGGAIAVPLRAVSPAAVQPTTAPPLTRALQPRGAPLLLIGLDGGNWAAIRPLLDSGRLPTLARLVREGQHGEVEASWPPYWSGPAWASIVTGQPPPVTGVTEDLVGTAPGFPTFELPLVPDLRLNPVFAIELELLLRGVMRAMPMPRDQLKYPPVWERVAAVGLRVGVVRFPFTYPASNPDIAVITNVASNDLWGFVRPDTFDRAKLVTPPDAAGPVLSRFEQPAHGGSAELRRLFPPVFWPKPRDTPEHPLHVLGRMFDVNEKTFDAAELLLRSQPPFDLFMLHVGSFDNICHAFWKFRFPEEFPGQVDAEDAKALGGVIDRYAEYLDRRLARVIALLPAELNVVIVADHGQEAIERHALWSGWHSRFGLFVAAGPGIAPATEPVRVSYFAVAPAIVKLLGFDLPADLSKGTEITSIQTR